MTSCVRCGAELRSENAGGFCVRCLLESGLDGPHAAVPAGDEVQATDSAREFGDYELLKEIARGGMGVVYRARQISLNRIVALKMIVGGPFASKQIIQRFRGEVTTAALLQHPNIVAIHEVGVHEDQHYFSMDYVQGPNLSQLAGARLLAPQSAARYVKIIAEAIHYAHEKGILHRDLKPSNVLVDAATDQPRITDFGLAKQLNGDSSLTLTGQVLGSPGFMPPEQAGGQRKVGRQSDVYGLGAILYYLLTLRAPFQAESIEGVVTQVLNDEPLPPRTLNPAVPRDLETISLKCLNKEPARRYGTAQDLADELGRFLRNEPIEARPVSQVEKAWRWCRRKPAIATLSLATGALLLALAIGGPIAIFRINLERRRAEQNLYDSDMSLAQQEWDKGNAGHAHELLQAHGPRPGEPDRRGFEWYYLSKLCQGEEKITFSGHNGPVTCLALTSDGRRLATGAFGTPVQVWNATTGARTQLVPETNVLSLAFSADNRLLAVGGMNEFSVWNLETGQAIFRHEEVLGKFQVAFPCFENQLVVGKRGGLRRFGNDGGSAEVWDYVTKERTRVFQESGGYIALGNGGRWLATGNAEQKIRIWDLGDGQLIQSLNTGSPSAMGLSPDGITLATSRAGEVAFWDVLSGRSTRQSANDLTEGWILAYSPDGHYLATGGTDQIVNLWDATTHQKLQSWRGHGSEIVSMLFSADSQTLASGSKDKTARLWKVQTTPRVTTVVTNLDRRHVFSPDSRWVAAGMKPEGVAMWDANTLELRAFYADAVAPVAFSIDSSRLIVRGKDYFLRTLDVSSGAIVKTVAGQSVAAEWSNTALSPDGAILAVGFRNGTLGLYDAGTGRQIAVDPEAFADAIIQLEFSPDGSLLAITGWEEPAGRLPSAKVWSVATREKIRVLTGHADTVLSVAFSRDRRTLMTSGADNAMRFWDTKTWNESSPPVTQKVTILSLAISQDGKTFASLTADSNLTLWSVATRRELITLKAPPATQYISFSPDGQTLAAYSWRGELRLWRAPIR